MSTWQAHGNHLAMVPNGRNCISLMARFRSRSGRDIKLRARTLGYQSLGSSLQWLESILEDAPRVGRGQHEWGKQGVTIERDHSVNIA